MLEAAVLRQAGADTQLVGERLGVAVTSPNAELLDVPHVGRLGGWR